MAKECANCGEPVDRGPRAIYCSKYCQEASWKLRNKDRYQAKIAEWRETNPDYSKNWRRDNPERAAYNSHRWNAKKRGIDFLLTFEEWCSVWGDQLKDKEGLCMCRTGDTGAYEIGNVRIGTRNDNVQEYWDLKRKYL